MAVISESLVESAVEEVTPKKSWANIVWSSTKKYPLGAFGMAVVVLMIFLAVFADVLTPYDPESNAFEFMLTSPNADYWMGTDQFGRDILTRIIYGARTALLVGFTCAIVGSFTGLVLGVASAYFGGLFDLIFQRIMDVFMAFPLIIMALAVVSIFGTGTQNVIIAITIPFIPRCARVVRSSALAIREIPYVDAARALGFGHSRIILRHMTPNVMAPFLIMLSAFVGQAILLEASLSYLGLGAQPPASSWGRMLSEAQTLMYLAPQLAIYPGLCIVVAVLGFGLLGDGLHDITDPRLVRAR